MEELSVVLPCFNESGNIPEILARFGPMAAAFSFELILVNNGSTDDSADVLRKELARPGNEFARTVLVEENLGYGHGLQAGLLAARAPVVAYTHADLQCPPEAVKTAYDLFRHRRLQGNCLVTGKRRGGRPWPDRCVTFFYNRLSHFFLGLTAASSDQPDRPHACDVNAQPKLFPREIIEELAQGPKDFTFDLYTLFVARRKGWPIVEFETPYDPRSWGTSKLAANPAMRVKTALKAFKKILDLRGEAPKGFPRNGGKS